MTKYIFPLLLILTAFVLPLNAQDKLSEAEKYANGKDYTTAISVLTAEASTRGYSSALYCDLGILYHEAGNFGAAVASFQRALRLDPHNRQARNNLAYTLGEVQLINESLTGDRNLDATPASATGLAAVAAYIARPGSNLWTGTSIVLFILAVTGVGLYIFSTKVSIKKWGFFGGGVLLVLSMIALWFAFIARSSQLSTDRGVIMSPQVQLLSAPGKEGKPVAAPLVGGSPVKILATQTDKDSLSWTKVSLNTDYEGWIPTADLETITVPAQ